MTIEELNAKIGLTVCEIDDISCVTEECTKLSIQFAIEVLEELHSKAPVFMIGDKIQELKQYLDE